jgi:uncharacterized protein DUF3592
MDGPAGESVDESMDIFLRLLMAVGGFGFFCGGIFMSRDAVLIQLRRGVAPGLIEATRFIRRHGSDSDREAYVSVVFEAAGRTPVRFEQSAPSGLFTMHTAASVQSLEGCDVPVHYDRTNPRRATITPLRDVCSGIAFSLVGLFVFLATLFSWTVPSGFQ